MYFSVNHVCVLELSAAEVEELKALTFPQGLMRGCLTELVEDRPLRASRSLAIIAKNAVGEVVGWGLLFENRFGRVELYMFVSEHCRRKGIGTKIAAQARRLRPRHKILVRPHDGAGFTFFTRFPRFEVQGSRSYITGLKRDAAQLSGEEVLA